MKPNEKAVEMYDKYFAAIPIPDLDEYQDILITHKKKAIKCALIAVDELINVAQYKAHLGNGHPEVETFEYWVEVKAELEKL